MAGVQWDPAQSSDMHEDMLNQVLLSLRLSHAGPGHLGRNVRGDFHHARLFSVDKRGSPTGTLFVLAVVSFALVFP